MSPAEYDGLILNISVASDAGQCHSPVAFLWHSDVAESHSRTRSQPCQETRGGHLSEQDKDHVVLWGLWTWQELGVTWEMKDMGKVSWSFHNWEKYWTISWSVLGHFGGNSWGYWNHVFEPWNTVSAQQQLCDRNDSCRISSVEECFYFSGKISSSMCSYCFEKWKKLPSKNYTALRFVREVKRQLKEVKRSSQILFVCFCNEGFCWFYQLKHPSVVDFFFTVS